MAPKDGSQKQFCPLQALTDVVMEPNHIGGGVIPKPLNITFPCRTDCAWYREYINGDGSCAVLAIAKALTMIGTTGGK